MKTLIKFPAMMLGLLLLLTGTTQSAKAQYDDVSLQTFYDELSPYGTWINDPEYGYVWRPDVDQADFRPYYSNGRWAMTEYGNTWVSNYEWGWAPFHYGRWMYNRYNNWVWLPDTTWGPAWVDWRSGGGYYGWAPMGPSINININIGRRYVTPDYCWNFIPSGHIYYNSYPRYYSGRNRVYIQNTVIINNTYVRNNRTYYSGPRIEDVRRATNQNVTVYNVSRTNRTGGNRIENNTVNVYAPRPSRGSDNAKAAPREAVRGSITRDRIERTSPASRSGRGTDNGSYTTNNNGRSDRFGGRGNDNNNTGRGERTERGERTQRNTDVTTPSRESRERAGNESGSIFGRSRDRGTVTTNEQNNRGTENRGSTTTPPTTQERIERNDRFGRGRERSSENIPSRSSSSEGRVQQSAPPQRTMERQQPQRTERVERSQQRPQQSSGSSSRSGESSGRSSRGEGSGRPGRG